MDLSGALFEPSLLERLERLNGLRMGLLAASKDNAGPAELPHKQGQILKTVVRVLANAGKPMHVASIHQAAEDLLGQQISRSTVKDCLWSNSKGDNPRFQRRRHGWYRATD